VLEATKQKEEKRKNWMFSKIFVQV
jgi:hypothetical protein